MTAKGLFITGTGTELGKTEVTALLARQLRAERRAVRALKPVISGFALDDPASDTRRLADAQGLAWGAETARALSPLQFKAPLSPDMAAAREGRRLDLDMVVAATRAGLPDRGVVLVEGVGGAFVPLCPGVTVADWIAALGLPPVVVAGSYLGTMSHTIATVEALAARGLATAAVVVSQSPDQPVPVAETVATLGRHLRCPVWALPRLTGQEVPPDLTGLADLAGAVGG
ncbi:dethiobiotin synthetase [Rhodothalassium salexigens DSM 2132]|uniref:ATP-dependent dethiobiotin synthetase BioD n=1 Tax=Rhodothalassium salexigens DSM 2132 TaxID=1188247 RepID=A0A4R2P852_RHOSA|nr:dethiobiotin synthase [Rhodothalassium salexigens]MBB4212537.1 dethiobiotin synthetase [Rhodothalassium salexigens DSM 2132]MBK1639670.1 dethiobiotin synthase [Rhodothalassium salexigens DSM 2132]TCP31082.1 dethiobiotin synthetase [Rhodothalassium salexigens DSM 2132]